jgi:hypothetical protein
MRCFSSNDKIALTNSTAKLTVINIPPRHINLGDFSGSANTQLRAESASQTCRVEAYGSRELHAGGPPISAIFFWAANTAVVGLLTVVAKCCAL